MNRPKFNEMFEKIIKDGKLISPSRIDGKVYSLGSFIAQSLNGLLYNEIVKITEDGLVEWRVSQYRNLPMKYFAITPEEFEKLIIRK